jgi:predicted phosphoadenosine phosphosulfate sulfurtransferase
MPKRKLDMNVLEAARKRVSYVFDHFDAPYVSFSGGKDSTVLLHLAAEALRELGYEVTMCAEVESLE